MKLGVLTVLLSQQPLEEVCAYLAKAGVQTIELGCGGDPGTSHCNPAELLASPAALDAFKQPIARHGLEISALSVHGNPVHPDAAVAKGFVDDFKNTVLLAEKLGIDTVITFSGCPGDHPGGKYPNWVTCPWPDDFGKILEYQWNEVLIPYWKQEAAWCRQHGVNKIALEMHPGFCVYNPETLLRLRDAVGPGIGANFDPSHLFWQGIDPISAIRCLKDCIFHFHAKDSAVDMENVRINGVLDTKHYGDEINRAWIFRAVGYGHGAGVWNDIISNLRLVGYDGAISIEHEDSLMSANEGLMKAVAFLKDVIIFESKGEMWWA